MTTQGASRTPELIEVLRIAIEQELSELFVALPGRVEKYNPATQTADVLPLLKRPFVNEDGSEGADALQTIAGVPVWFPRGGGYFMSMPVTKGDHVLLVFCDSALDNYIVGDGTTVADPKILRNHDISDCVAIPGFGTLSRVIKDVIASGAAFGKEAGPQVRATDAAIEITSGGLPAAIGGFVAMAQKVDSMWTALTVFLDGFVPTPGDGGAALKTAMSAAIKLFPAYQASASTNLKAN